MSPQFRPPLRLHDRLRVRVDRLGNEGIPVIVIDDFLHDAEHLVEYAARVSGFRRSPEIYPGHRAPIPMPYPLAVRTLLDAAMREVFGLGGLDVIDSRSDFSIVTKRPGDIPARKRVPHTDTSDPNFIVVLHYLCTGRHGGTSFYRHRATSFETVAAARKPSYLERLEAELDAAAPDDYAVGDTAIFERIAGYEAVFNRAIIYRGIDIHGADIPADFAFDPDPRAGRLTANTSFLFGRASALSLSAKARPAFGPDWGWLPALKA
jgi:hypothetical protein